MEGSRPPSTETLDVFRISRPDAGRRALGFGGRAAGRCRDVAALDAGRGVMEPGSAATEASAKARAQGHFGELVSVSRRRRKLSPLAGGARSGRVLDGPGGRRPQHHAGTVGRGRNDLGVGGGATGLDRALRRADEALRGLEEPVQAPGQRAGATARRRADPQFGRMGAKLGIELIAASSPQAKGRVERIHGMHQERLVKKRRRKRIANHTEANQYLELEYLPEHNRRFTRAVARPENYHHRAPCRSELDRILRLKSERTISDDWVVRSETLSFVEGYDNRFFQLDPQSRNYAPARGKSLP